MIYSSELWWTLKVWKLIAWEHSNESQHQFDVGF